MPTAWPARLRTAPPPWRGSGLMTCMSGAAAVLAAAGPSAALLFLGMMTAVTPAPSRMGPMNQAATQPNRMYSGTTPSC